MPEPSAKFNQPEVAGPIARCRIVADWEYKTAYIPTFQVRITPDVHDRLSEWAKRDSKPLGVLVIEILEQAVRRRGS